MTDFSHLDALQVGLSHERDRLAKAKKPGEIALRKVWVAQYEKVWVAQYENEIAAEYEFLGITPLTLADILVSDDELLAALS